MTTVGKWSEVREFLTRRLWQAELGSLSYHHRLLYQALRVLFVLGREISSGQLNLRAMSLVYTTLLSLVPLLALSFSVLKGFGLHNEIEPMLRNFLLPLGPMGEEVLGHIIGFVDRMKVGVLGALGLGFLIYTVIALIQKVESAFNYVWHIRRGRSLARRFSDYLSVAMVGPLLIFLAMALTASVMNSAVVQSLLAVEPLGSLLLGLGRLMPYVFVIIAFAFLYIFIPNTKVKWRAALMGALVGGILWQSVGVLFASFAVSSTRYAAIYSGLAILILFMIWLYLSWFILLFGAQVAYFTQNPGQIRREREEWELSIRDRERLALSIMYRVVESYTLGRRPRTMDDLAESLRVPADELRMPLDALLRLGYLAESCDEEEGFLPARDPDNVELYTLWCELRAAGEGELAPRAKAPAAVDSVLEALEQVAADDLKGMTLKGLVGGAKELLP